MTRTYDKLIATITTRQSTGGLRLSFGFTESSTSRPAGPFQVPQAHRRTGLQSDR